MKTTLNIPEDILKEAMAKSKCKTRTDTVISGLKELIRKNKIERVLSSAGKLEFSDGWDKSRHAR